jgi:hypothetical protein
MFELKVSALLRLLSGCAFHQAAVFCNNKPQVGREIGRGMCTEGMLE